MEAKFFLSVFFNVAKVLAFIVKTTYLLYMSEWVEYKQEKT